MVAKKRKSKRQTLQQKYKIQKRTKEHKKRVKKGSIDAARRLKVDGGIPNAWPFKEDLLKEISVAKLKIEERKQHMKEKRQEEFARRRAGGGDGASSAMDVTDGAGGDDAGAASSRNKLLHLGSTAAGNDDEDGVDGDGDGDVKTPAAGQNSRRAYLRELRKVVEGSDVILQVLDARDPLGTLSTAVEEMVMSKAGKRLVYVLNKADLVPRDVLAGWLAHLRKSHPAVPFKCNTQSQKGNLGRSSGKVQQGHESALQTNSAVGAEELIGLLKNYARVGDTKSVIAVGIVGFPNVGKSSLINSLTRTRAVGVSSMPGFTKVAQEVILDKNIRLMDSPGIVFADGDSAATALRNCVNVEEMEDVLTPLQAILERCPQAYLMQLYAIPKFKALDAMSFLALVARVTGKLKKGGIPNTDAAARTVLHDWNSGKIKYYCRPPKATGGGEAGEGDSAILSSFSDGFDLDAMQASDVRVLGAIEAAVAAADSAAGAGAGSGGFVSMNEVAPRLHSESLLQLQAASSSNMGVMDAAHVAATKAAAAASRKQARAAASATSDDVTEAGSITSRRSSGTNAGGGKGGAKLLSKTALAGQAVDYQQPPVPGALDRKTLKEQQKRAKKTASRAASAAMAEDYDFGSDFKA